MEINDEATERHSAIYNVLKKQGDVTKNRYWTTSNRLRGMIFICFELLNGAMFMRHSAKISFVARADIVCGRTEGKKG